MRKEVVPKIVLSFVFSILMLSSATLATGFSDVTESLKEIGVFEFYLPFLLVFTILFGLLQKIKLFGEQGKAINIIVSLAVAGFILVYTPVGITFSQFLTNFFGNVVVVILTLIVIVLFAAIVSTGFGFEFKELFKGKGVILGALLLLALIVFGVFVASGGSSIFPGIKIGDKTFDFFGGINTGTWALIILIVGTGIIVALFALTKEGKAG